jgi:hypothetical protein
MTKQPRDPRMRFTVSPLSEIDRFMNFVSPEPNSGCWLWMGSTVLQDYGEFYVSPSVGKMRAHRWIYLHTFGEFDKALLVCHRCDNPNCVNPGHLFLGTVKDNGIDASKKGRVWCGGADIPNNARRTHCFRGHPFSGDNLVRSKSGVKRWCRACWKINAAKKRALKQAKIVALPTHGVEEQDAD